MPCGFFFTLPSPVNQLPKVLISNRTASPLPDLGCPVAPFASERRHSGPRAGPVTSSVWRKSRASSGSCSQFRGLSVRGGGGKIDPPRAREIKPPRTQGACSLTGFSPSSSFHCLPSHSPSSFRLRFFSTAAEQKDPVEDGLIDGRAHSLAINSVVLCDSPDHQHLPRHCCHVGPLAGCEY